VETHVSEPSSTMVVVAPHSRSRIDRAGVALRAHQSGQRRLSFEELVAELEVVESFRAVHARPLTRVAANLRYFVAEASGGPFVVGQRLKRMDTIRDKLERQPRMSLSRMHDIGGCRAVLPDQAAVDQVIERLRAQRRWEMLDRTWDYVTHPKPDGYRAKHLVARKDGVLIEIQLRTEIQHGWAELVERLDRRFGTGLKTGRAEDRVRELLAAGSAVFANAEQTGLDASATMASLRSLFDAADDLI
jgi:ppGpp synthetase/RelA/SpoT-type nucleotidyltranferase